LTALPHARDNAPLMAVHGYAFFTTTESRFPGLLDAIHKIIRQSEGKHQGGGGSSESFLWEHAMLATSLAYQLAQAENCDPLIPVLASLFYEVGKSAGGDPTAEREESVRAAKRILRRFGMKSAEILRVMSGLRRLFTEKAANNWVAAIVHDADLLSRFGALGVADFFIKSALRRRTLRASVFAHLSKELTYAACLPLNMHTASGRALAARKASDSIRFFRALLAELREARIADFKIRQIRIPHPDDKDKVLKVQLVVAPACPQCGGVWSMAWTTDKDIQCRKLTIDWACSDCGARLQTSFRLPAIAY